MKKTLIFTFFILSIIVNINATIVTVTSTDDDADSPQAGMLRYHINNASRGDTIVFAVDYVELRSSLSISYKGLTIDGGDGVIIDGTISDRIFHITYDSNNKIVLKNLTILGGYLEDEISAWGGGMYVFGTGGNENFLVENCSFQNNEINCNGDGQGGALHTQGGTYINCSFLGNYVGGSGSSNTGGGVISIGATFINCQFADNYAKYVGGLYATNGTRIINCTITQNRSSNDSNGTGLTIQSGSSCINSIIFDNFNGRTQDNINVSDATLSYCAIESGNAMVGANSNIGLSECPFEHCYSGVYNLAEGSACINKGNSNLTEITRLDLAGNKRISDGQIDLGAYEFNN